MYKPYFETVEIVQRNILFALTSSHVYIVTCRYYSIMSVDLFCHVVHEFDSFVLICYKIAWKTCTRLQKIFYSHCIVSHQRPFKLSRIILTLPYYSGAGNFREISSWLCIASVGRLNWNTAPTVTVYYFTNKFFYFIFSSEYNDKAWNSCLFRFTKNSTKSFKLKSWIFNQSKIIIIFITVSFIRSDNIIIYYTFKRNLSRLTHWKAPL